MYSQLLVAALAASVSANLVVPGHLPMRRELQNLARQTGSAASPSGTATSDDACEGLALSLAASLPTAAPALESYEATYAATDPCSYSVPSSLSSDYSVYTDAFLSWYSASSAAVFSILSECPEYADEAATAIEVCSTATGLAAAGTTAASSGSASESTATGSASGSSATGSSAAGSSSPAKSSGAASTASGSAASASASGSGASAREVGIVGAVLVGVLGVAVAL